MRSAIVFAALFAVARCGGPFDGAFDGANGAVGAVDNSPERLFARQRQTCTLPPPWVPCPNGRQCCPAAQPLCYATGCCPTNQPQFCPGQTCCPTNANCFRPGLCCPKTAPTCNRGFCLGAGQSCCGQGFCDIGERCLKSDSGSEVCCLPGEVACSPNYCCPSGSTCARGGLCRLNGGPTTRAQTRTRDATATRVATGTRVTRPPQSTRRPTRTRTRSDDEEETETPTCEPISEKKKIKKRQTPDDPGDFVDVNGDCVPVMDFPCVQDLTDQLCASMCGGIANEKSKGSPSVLSDDAMVLTWRGVRKADPDCNGFCTGRRDSLGNRMECDEFPFAVTDEGGPGSHKMCISSLQNSRLQGPMIKQYANFYGLSPGDKFVVRISSCADFARLRRRDGDEDLPAVRDNDDGTQDLSSGFSDWVSDPNSESAGFIVMPLGNLTGGDYAGTLTLDNLDGLSDLRVIDGNGYEYWAADDVSSLDPEGIEIPFKVEEADDIVLAAAATESTPVDAVFTVKATPNLADSLSPNLFLGLVFLVLLF